TCRRDAGALEIGPDFREALSKNRWQPCDSASDANRGRRSLRSLLNRYVSRHHCTFLAARGAHLTAIPGPECRGNCPELNRVVPCTASCGERCDDRVAAAGAVRVLRGHGWP